MCVESTVIWHLWPVAHCSWIRKMTRKRHMSSLTRPMRNWYQISRLGRRLDKHIKLLSNWSNLRTKICRSTTTLDLELASISKKMLCSSMLRMIQWFRLAWHSMPELPFQMCILSKQDLLLQSVTLCSSKRTVYRSWPWASKRSMPRFLIHSKMMSKKSRRKPRNSQRIRQLQRVALPVANNRTVGSKRPSVVLLKTRTKMTMKKIQRRKALKEARTLLLRATKTSLHKPD